jgi:hypothetical protein
MSRDDRDAPGVDASWSRRDKGPGLLTWALAILLVGGGVLLGAVGWSVVSVARDGERTAGRIIEQITRPQPSPTPVLLTRAVVVRALSGASELTTAVYTMETVVDESQERRLGAFPLGRTQLLYIAHGQVRAGVDLDRIGEGDVSIGPDTVTVRLPPPRVLDAKIDVNRSYTYDVRRSLLGPSAPDLQSQAERFALERILDSACAGGVLQDASARAEVVVTRLLAATSRLAVHVTTQAPADDACAAPAAHGAGARSAATATATAPAAR